MTYKKTRKPEQSSLVKQKNTKEIIKSHKGTRMVKDGEFRLTRITNDELETFSPSFPSCASSNLLDCPLI